MTLLAVACPPGPSLPQPPFISVELILNAGNLRNCCMTSITRGAEQKGPGARLRVLMAASSA